MTKFQPGDKVKCIKNHSIGYTKGKIYTVEQFQHYTSDDMHSIPNNDGRLNTVNHPTFKGHFELVKEEVKRPVKKSTTNDWGF